MLTDDEKTFLKTALTAGTACTVQNGFDRIAFRLAEYGLVTLEQNTRGLWAHGTEEGWDAYLGGTERPS